jgi:uncharacterized protein involved in exopolysaccharide biosynthesis
VSSTPEDIKQPAPPAGDDDEISLLEILVTLARHKKLVFVFPFACAVVAALISLVLPNIYTGTAKILPPQQGGSSLAAALLGDVGGLSAGGAVGSALGLKNPSDLYVGMLQSRTIADAIIQRFDLKNLYNARTLVDTRRNLSDVSSITANRDGIINIEVDDEDPKRAAELANAYVAELDQLTQKVAITTAGRQRVFLEKQLRQAKDQLADAEVALRTTQEKTGLISLTEQGKATIESVAYLQAQIQAKQVQLGAMRTGMTESNPDYIRAQRELTGLQAELTKREKSNPADTSGVVPSAGMIPERGLEYVRKFRDVQYQQTLFDLIAKQFEIAKAQEAAEAGLIQVLDRAVVPDKKSKPYRLLIVLVTGILTGLLGMVAAFVLEARNRAKNDPIQSKLIDELKQRMSVWGRNPKARERQAR